MADESPFFVDVRNVFVDYVAAPKGIQRLLGKQLQTKSVLRDVRFQLAAGAQVTLYGGPATGKTTLLRVLAGIVQPSSGQVSVNGLRPAAVRDVAAGYVSSAESEPRGESIHDILFAFGTTHGVANLPARLGEVTEIVGLNELSRTAQQLATTERLRLNLARAALSHSPLILLDDVADELGAAYIQTLLASVFSGRTVVVATRTVTTAEVLELPILLLHDATLVLSGTCDEIANTLSCPRTLDVWIEGLRYDVLRKLRQHPGVREVRLLPSSQFSGQRLRIQVQSSRYLPSVYDVISQTPLIEVREIPASLRDILSRLR